MRGAGRYAEQADSRKPAADWTVTFDQDAKGIRKPQQLAAEEAKGMAYMGVFEMDLNDQAQMNKIFNQQTPVLILFYNGQRHEKED